MARKLISVRALLTVLVIASVCALLLQLLFSSNTNSRESRPILLTNAFKNEGDNKGTGHGRMIFDDFQDDLSDRVSDMDVFWQDYDSSSNQELQTTGEVEQNNRLEKVIATNLMDDSKPTIGSTTDHISDKARPEHTDGDEVPLSYDVNAIDFSDDIYATEEKSGDNGTESSVLPTLSNGHTLDFQNTGHHPVLEQATTTTPLLHMATSSHKMGNEYSQKNLKNDGTEVLNGQTLSLASKVVSEKSIPTVSPIEDEFNSKASYKTTSLNQGTDGEKGASVIRQSGSELVRNPSKSIAAIQYGVASPELLGDSSLMDHAVSLSLQKSRRDAVIYLKRYLKVLNKRNQSVGKEISESGTSKGSMLRSGDNINKVSKVVIVSTWRSGSTFLGDLLASNPSVFYTFEPLKPFEEELASSKRSQFISLINDSGKQSYSRSALIESIFTCNFSSLLSAPNVGAYVDNFLMPHAAAIHRACSRRPSVCRDKSFLEQACSLFPVRLVKTVRAMVADIVPVVEAGAKLIYLIRDPRATWLSRSRTNWCSERCNSTSQLCADLVDNMAAAASLQQRFPDRVITVKYELMAEQPASMAKKIFRHVGLPVTKSTVSFLIHHTRQVDNVAKEFGAQAESVQFNDERSDKWKSDPMSTIRDSRETAIKWRTHLSMSTVQTIQNTCAQVLHLLEYRNFTDETDLHNTSISVSRD